MAHNKTFSP